MKLIELLHAEVTTFYGTNDVLKEFETEKGTVMTFTVKTKVNDRTEKSPLVWDTCKYFADSSEKVDQIRGAIKLGNILDIKGNHDVRSYEDKEGNKKYSNSVNVKYINPITDNDQQPSQPEATPAVADDDLPF
jgi:hypothetical protein